MTNWIQEHLSASNQLQDNDHWKTREDFLQILAIFDPDEQELINSIAESVMNIDGCGEALLDELTRQYSSDSFVTDMLLTLGCARALIKSPDIRTWQKIKKITCHSWSIEHWLSEAMLAYASLDTANADAYVTLVSDVFLALENRELKSESERRNNARENNWNYWEHNESQLKELFEGLRGSDFMNYEEEMRLFGVLNEINSNHFQLLLSRSNNPFLLDNMLLSSGVGMFNPRFSQWALSVKNAPEAFKSDGSWSGSVLLPLLLTHGRSHLLRPSSQVPQYGANEEDVVRLTAQVNDLVQAVVDTLYARIDAHALLTRWSIWLMKQVLSHREKKFNDIRAGDFVDNALLIAIGKNLHGKPLNMVPKDADTWEVWCLYCVKAFFASEGLSDAPDFAQIGSHWKLSPEDWHQEKGRHLLHLASLHLPREHMPDLSAHLLAFPLSSQADFATCWQQLWNDTSVLREILEFGSADVEKNSYSDRGDASKLLLLLTCIGLACLDQSINQYSESDKTKNKHIISLYSALSDAVIETLYIDDTIYNDSWHKLLHHLALRRVFWDETFVTSQAKNIFTSDDKPTPEFWIKFLKTSGGELIAYLHDCLLNGAQEDKLREVLIKTTVDLKAMIEVQRRLNDFREVRYRFDSRAISAVEKLIET